MGKYVANAELKKEAIEKVRGIVDKVRSEKNSLFHGESSHDYLGYDLSDLIIDSTQLNEILVKADLPSVKFIELSPEDIPSDDDYYTFDYESEWGSFNNWIENSGEYERFCSMIDGWADHAIEQLDSLIVAESNLNSIRIAKNMSRKELAEKSGVKERMIGYYENGYRDIDGANIETLIDIASALCCAVRDIVSSDLAEKIENTKF